MSLIKLIAASVALTYSGMAMASDYVVNLQPGNAGLIRGHAGLHAVDDKNERALVRIVSPGNKIDKRGTIRVLVMNLGKQPFEFGPDNVTLTLADGSELSKVPLKEFERGYAMISREQDRAKAINMQTRNTLSSIGGTVDPGSGGPDLAHPRASVADGAGIDSFSQSDDSTLPGNTMLNAIYEVLLPETVEPQAAAGGYLVFELPERLKGATGDVPLTITVRTGDDEHRFAGLLKQR